MHKLLDSLLYHKCTILFDQILISPLPLIFFPFFSHDICPDNKKIIHIFVTVKALPEVRIALKLAQMNLVILGTPEVKLSIYIVVPILFQGLNSQRQICFCSQGPLDRPKRHLFNLSQ